MKKIAIFQKDLDIGGIQRSLLNFVTNMDLSAYEVDLFLFKEPTICTLEDLKGINVTVLKPLFYLNRVVKFDVLLKRCNFDLPDKEYDLAIDFNSYSNECALCAVKVNAKKRVMWIHNDLIIEYKENRKYRILFSAFKGKYKYFDEFVAVSRGIVAPFRKQTGIGNDVRIRVIPNTINTQMLFKKASEPVDFTVDQSKVNFVFVGRFTKQKGIDMLLDYFAEALSYRNDIHLYLLGDGSERIAVEQQIASLKIGENVTLVGSVENPYPYMDKMDALVLTSRHEGQGMVLWEAKALGLDIIFSKNLEKYNDSLVGNRDIVKSIVLEQKHTKSRNMLDSYNLKIKNSLYELFDR